MGRTIAILDIYGNARGALAGKLKAEVLRSAKFYSLDGKIEASIVNASLDELELLVVPVKESNMASLHKLLEQLKIPKEKIALFTEKNVEVDDFQTIEQYLDDKYASITEACRYESRIHKLMESIKSHADDTRVQPPVSTNEFIELYEKGRTIFCFLGFDQSSVKVLYGGFGKVEGTGAFFLNPWSNDRAKELEDMFECFNDYDPNYVPFFLVYARVYEVWRDIPQLLKLRFPRCKLALYYGDLISKHAVLPEEVRQAGFDYVFSFDAKDAKRNGIFWLQEPLSNLPNVSNAENEKYDVMFVGEAKDRLDALISTYEKMKEEGLKCAFYIFRVSDKDMKYSDEIKYNRWLDYSDILEIDRYSHCLLEIMQGGDSYSPTTRYSEAKLLGKKLITNCPALRESNDKNIIWFSDISEIDLDRIKEPYYEDGVDYRTMLSIEGMINSIIGTMADTDESSI